MDTFVPSSVFNHTKTRYFARENRAINVTNHSTVISVTPKLGGNYMHSEAKTAQKVVIVTPPTLYKGRMTPTGIRTVRQQTEVRRR